MSRIRANQITNQAADGAPTVQHGLIIAGVSTFTGSVSIGGTLTYEDVTNIDSIGIITARSGVDVDDFVSVGSNIHLGNAGIITATSFVGSGANLTGITIPGGGTNLDLLDSSGTGNGRIRLGASQDLQIYHDGSHSWFKNTTGRLLLQTDGDQIQLRGNTIVAFNGAASTEYLRIDSAGRVLIGRTASRNVGGSTTYARLQVAGTSQVTSSMSLVNNEQDTKGPFVFFGKTRGNSVGESGIVQNGDTLGGLSFIGADGNDTNNRTAEITAVVNGTPANNTIPTDLVFSTSPQHAGQLAERVRIPSTGGIELKTDGKGIQFPTPQTPSNSDGNRVGISSEMRYYETGTFVPGLSSTVLNSLQNPVFTDASYARRIGRYVRVGHLVFCNVSIKMASSITFATGAHTGIAPVSIVGVTPFKYSYAGRYAASGEPDYNPCNIWYNGSGLTDDTLYATMQRHFPGQTHIQITKPSSGGVQNHASTNYGEVFPADSHVVVSYTYAIDLDNADY